MILIKNKQQQVALDVNVLQKTVQQLLEILGYTDFDIGILFTTNAVIQEYNKQYRHQDVPTDILSFPYYPDVKPGQRIEAQSAEEKNLGDIIISPEYLWQQFATMPDWSEKTAAQQRKLVDERIIELIVHGICHLLGYGHTTDAEYKAMQQKERQLLHSLVK